MGGLVTYLNHQRARLVPARIPPKKSARTPKGDVYPWMRSTSKFLSPYLK